jgi:hypothetical protein
MITAEALASIDIAWIFAFIFRRSRKTRDRLAKASDRLPPAFCWIDHDPEEVGFGQRHPLVKLGAGLAKRHTDGLCLDDRLEFGFGRLGRLVGDDLDRVQQRQAGLDATDDDVDRVRERVEKLVLAALLEEREQPHRKAGSGREGEGQSWQRSGLDEHQEGKHGDAEAAGHEQELLLAHREPGLIDPRLQRRLLRLVVLDLEVLEALLDLLAPRFLNATADARRRGLRPGYALPAPFRRAFAGEDRIEEHPGDAADRKGRQEE